MAMAIGCSSTLSAATPQPLQLNALFQDHAVLQRDRPIPVWGQAPAGETVTVSLQAAAGTPRTAQAKTDVDGHWSASLPATEAGGPFELTAKTSSGATQAAHDVLVGDVFLCSGQSNMEMSVLRAGDSYGEINKPANNTIRWLNVVHAISTTPQTTFASPVSWQISAPDTVPDWSAVCLFFARELQPTIRVPVGLIQSTWSGSNIRPWISAPTLHANGGYEPALGVLAAYAQDPAAGQRQMAGAWEQWWRGASGDEAGAEPWSAKSSGKWRQAPAALGDWRSWGVPELQAFTGMVWFRTEFKLTAAQVKSLKQTVTLTLGKINQVDETWLNGHAIGNTFGYETPRAYELPSTLLHAGTNVLVVNVLSTYGVGGLLSGGPDRAIHLPNGDTIPLNGPWQYRIVPKNLGDPPRAPWESVGGLTTIYNAMIAPLGPYALRAALWYQGESNTSEWQTYQGLLSSMMHDWRRQFGSDLPFLIVQLPDFGPYAAAPSESEWAGLREAQRLAVKNDPHAALAVTIDIGEPHNLHPTNKQDVAKRLFQAARHIVYGDSTPPSGPTPVRAMRNGQEITVEFGDIGKGLVVYGHAQPIGFEVCGDEPGSCRFAAARLAGSQVKVTSEAAATRVRYLWADSPICTLFDLSGVPVGPFELKLQ
ncbi:MAG: beta galactosidase jelly roll domain-containing protein [Proteobacteria bacterium]|nr:beta galactosidase jelly roll domain-containing protein [Pseudomonadota bacterium]